MKKKFIDNKIHDPMQILVWILTFLNSHTILQFHSHSFSSSSIQFFFWWKVRLNLKQKEFCVRPYMKLKRKIGAIADCSKKPFMIDGQLLWISTLDETSLSQSWSLNVYWRMPNDLIHAPKKVLFLTNSRRKIRFQVQRPVASNAMEAWNGATANRVPNWQNFKEGKVLMLHYFISI